MSSKESEKAKKTVAKTNTVTVHEDRWDKTTNQLVSNQLPSLNDKSQK